MSLIFKEKVMQQPKVKKFFDITEYVQIRCNKDGLKKQLDFLEASGEVVKQKEIDALRINFDVALRKLWMDFNNKVNEIVKKENTK